MTVKLRQVAPHLIEQESFKIIEQEIGAHDFNRETFKIVQRVIHATGDFSFKENMRFSDGAVEAGINAIRSGKNILTDVNMVAAGISKTLLAKFGGNVICKVADMDVATKAKAEKKTRSEVAIETSLDASIGIVAMGNAPTALIQTIKSLENMPEAEKPLIVGVPVGFVNASESKDLLVEKGTHYITSLGRKGGSPVAAAIVNAMIRLALEK